MDFSTRLRGINPTNTVFYSPQPRAEVYCLLMNFKISKLAYLEVTDKTMGEDAFQRRQRVTKWVKHPWVNLRIVIRLKESRYRYKCSKNLHTFSKENTKFLHIFPVHTLSGPVLGHFVVRSPLRQPTGFSWGRDSFVKVLFPQHSA